MRAVLSLMVAIVWVSASSPADAQRAKAPPVVTNPPSVPIPSMPKPVVQDNRVRPSVPVLTQIAKRPVPQQVGSPARQLGAAASPRSSREHLIKTMQQLQSTYRQQAILLSQLIPHMQPQQHGDLQNAIARAQASREKLATQLKKMQVVSLEKVAVAAISTTKPTPRNVIPSELANSTTAVPVPLATGHHAMHVPQRFPQSNATPEPIQKNVQASAAERIPPQPGDLQGFPVHAERKGSQAFEKIFQGRATTTDPTTGNRASAIPSTVDDGPVKQISAESPNRRELP